MQIIDKKLFIIDNFIFPETCNFLINSFSQNLKETGKPGGFVGPLSTKKNPAKNLCGMNKISEKSNTHDYNIAIDLFTSICTNIEKTASLVFNKNLIMRSYFYSHMTTGGQNSLHADNYFEEYSEDISGILYLSDSYDGGMINFPGLGQKFKFLPGTLIMFIGNDEMKHEVEEVLSGNRINIICFLNKKEQNEN